MFLFILAVFAVVIGLGAVEGVLPLKDLDGRRAMGRAADDQRPSDGAVDWHAHLRHANVRRARSADSPTDSPTRSSPSASYPAPDRMQLRI